jgi:hypothetical protein
MDCHRFFFRLSRISARRGRRIVPPGRIKMTMTGTIFDMFRRCFLISFFSSLVQGWSVFRIFMSSCISPLTARTSCRRKALLLTINLFIRLDIILFLRVMSRPPWISCLRWAQQLSEFCNEGSPLPLDFRGTLEPPSLSRRIDDCSFFS